MKRFVSLFMFFALFFCVSLASAENPIPKIVSAMEKLDCPDLSLDDESFKGIKRIFENHGHFQKEWLNIFKYYLSRHGGNVTVIESEEVIIMPDVDIVIAPKDRIILKVCKISGGNLLSRNYILIKNARQVLCQEEIEKKPLAQLKLFPSDLSINKKWEMK